MKRIYLIGYMGVGKSTIGKRLSKLLNLSFIDLDILIESKYHKSISDIFKDYGEDGFREIERKSLQEVSEIEDVVIATGGGTPCFFDNMELMNSTGITVYVKAEPKDLVEQLQISKRKRPLIANKTADSLLPFITNHLNEREVFYTKADIIFNVKKLVSITELNNTVTNIANELNKMTK